jgi:RNA polymerase sigma-70 factor, ECF subfamily
MAIQHEQELIKNARSFNQQALGEIYDTCSPELYGYAMRLLGDELLAEDCVADTFSRFLQALRLRKGPDRFLRAYLFRIAHNWITDYYRRHTPELVELDESIQAGDHNETEKILERRFESQQLRVALRTLTPDQRQVIMLKFVEEWKNEEIAAALERPVGAVKALQHRAIDTLRRSLSEVEKAGRS